MKRYRHYQRGTAIVLAAFGSVIEQEMYRALVQDVQKRFAEADVFLSFSSRMVLKALNKEQPEYQNLPQVLADVDLMGYKRIVVASINLFPTDEHEVLLKIVEGFYTFSMANIRATRAILHKTKETSLALKGLNDAIIQPDQANLYIIHGAPVLDRAGLASVSYAEGLLERLGEHNYTCSLEGAYPWYAVKESLIEKMKQEGVHKVQVVPMLLVSGNHYRKDMVEITEELSKHFEARIVPSQSASDRFNLIELESVREIVFGNIADEMAKMGCG